MPWLLTYQKQTSLDVCSQDRILIYFTSLVIHLKCIWGFGFFVRSRCETSYTFVDVFPEWISVCFPQLMSKSSEKPRLRQIPSEDMDSEDSSAGDAHQDRVRAESQRELENQEEQLNLQHALLLNQVRHKPPNLKQTCKRRISHTPLVVPKTSAKMLSRII